MATEIINLGTVRGIVFGVNPPSNKKILWYDESVGQKIVKYYNTVTAAWESVFQDLSGYISEDEVGQGLIFENNELKLDLDAKTLVSPVISVQWALFKNDGSTPYVPANSTSKTLIVDKGVKADLVAVYQYPQPGAGQGLPTAVTGSFGTTLPAPNTASAPPLVANDVATDATYTVSLSKPKTGLIVVGGQVVFATGNDITTDQATISFRSKSYVGYSASTSLNSAQILALANRAFASSKVRTVSGVTAGVGLYTYIVYEAAFGDLTNVIMNGAAPILGAFTKLTDVVVTNDAGFAITMRVYKSNATQAFTGDSLAIS